MFHLWNDKTAMQDLNDLYFYVQIVDHGGFAPAGRALGLPKSTLSRRLAALEERLGVRLIQRSSRHFSVTEIGQMYYQRCVAMLVEADSAQDIIERHRSEPQGSVRISCPLALLDYGVNELLARYMAAYPQVKLEVESTNRRVDVIREGFDVALRVRAAQDVVMVVEHRAQGLLRAPELRHEPVGDRQHLRRRPEVLLEPHDLRARPSGASGGVKPWRGAPGRWRGQNRTTSRDGSRFA